MRALFCLAVAFACTAAPNNDLLRSSTEMVLIGATVLDPNGHFVTDVPPEQFRIDEEAKPQEIAAVTLEDAPVSVIFVVDLSRSMSKAIPDIRAAIARLAESSKSEDEYMLITVRAAPSLDFPFSPGTADIEDFVLSQQAGGGTALIDGLMLALHESSAARHARRAIVVLSDGEDTASRYTWSELRNAARETDAVLYAFSLPSYGRDARNDEWQLARIAKETGGRHVFVKKPKLFVLKLEALDVHQQYVLAYAPTDREHNGKYRRVKVSLIDTQRKLKVFWKRGYYSPSP